MPLYISAEQELVLRDHLLLEEWATRLPPTDDPRHNHFLVVTDVPFGNEGPGWAPALIGPIAEYRVQHAMESLKTLLQSLGHTVYDVFDAPGEWHGGFFAPEETPACESKGT